jgi:hypothetical protein
MKPFVIIFRQHQNQLTQSDLEARASEMPAWVEAHNRAGHKLEPRILEPDSRGGAVQTAEEGPLTALLFLEARDIDQAFEIARSHPGCRYGASVEVRAWVTPPAR